MNNLISLRDILIVVLLGLSVGTPIAMCMWFAFRMENKLDAMADKFVRRLDNLIRAIDDLVRSYASLAHRPTDPQTNGREAE